MTPETKFTYADSPAFDGFSDQQLATLDAAIKTVDRHAYISTVDYKEGKIGIGIVYNSGTPDEFANADILVVNVASDSVASAFYDVYTRAYERFI